MNNTSNKLQQNTNADLISIVIPCYNEQNNITAVLRELQQVTSSISSAVFEIIVVDDGSYDDTPSVLKSIQKDIPNMKVIRLKENMGQSTAMAIGIKKANGKYIITMDADGQNDPADIPLLLQNIKDYSCVCGYRKKEMISGQNVLPAV